VCRNIIATSTGNEYSAALCFVCLRAMRHAHAAMRACCVIFGVCAHTRAVYQE
jgi:hypothetical protein